MFITLQCDSRFNLVPRSFPGSLFFQSLPSPISSPEFLRLFVSGWSPGVLAGMSRRPTADKEPEKLWARDCSLAPVLLPCGVAVMKYPERKMGERKGAGKRNWRTLRPPPPRRFPFHFQFPLHVVSCHSCSCYCTTASRSQWAPDQRTITEEASEEGETESRASGPSM